MILQLDREKKIVLLKWLKQGYINTLDLPEAYKDGNLFLDLLMSSGVIEEKGDDNRQEK